MPTTDSQPLAGRQRGQCSSYIRKWKLDTISRLGGSIALYGLTGLAGKAWPYPVVEMISVGCMGLVLAGFFGAMHRAAHGALWPARRFNEILGRGCALLMLTSFTFFRRLHQRHHRYSGTELDPEGLHPVENPRDFLTAILGANFLTCLTPSTLSLALFNRKPEWLNGKSAMLARRDARQIVVLIAGTAAATTILPGQMLYWYWGPLLIAALFDGLLSLPEHLDDQGRRRTTRSVSSPIWFRFLNWNENYHVEHHQHPGLPAMEMPALQSLKAHELIIPSYLKFFSDIIRLSFNITISKKIHLPRNN